MSEDISFFKTAKRFSRDEKWINISKETKTNILIIEGFVIRLLECGFKSKDKGYLERSDIGKCAYGAISVKKADKIFDALVEKKFLTKKTEEIFEITNWNKYQANQKLSSKQEFQQEYTSEQIRQKLLYLERKVKQNKKLSENDFKTFNIISTNFQQLSTNLQQIFNKLSTNFSVENGGDIGGEERRLEEEKKEEVIKNNSNELQKENSNPSFVGTNETLDNQELKGGLSEKEEKKEKTSKKKEKADALSVLEEIEDILLPCPRADLQRFIEHRKEIKKPLFKQGLEAIIRKLNDFKTKGFDPIASIDQSIVKGYQDVFEVKQYNTPQSQNKPPYNSNYGASNTNHQNSNQTYQNQELSPATQRWDELERKTGNDMFRILNDKLDDICLHQTMQMDDGVKLYWERKSEDNKPKGNSIPQSEIAFFTTKRQSLQAL